MSTKIKWGPLLSWSFLEGKFISHCYLVLRDASSFHLKNVKVVVHYFPKKTDSCGGYLFWLCLFIIIMSTLSPLPCIAQRLEKLLSPDTSVAPRIIRTKRKKKLQNSRYWSPNYKEIKKNIQALENSVPGVESKRGTKIYYNKIIKSFLKV